MDRLRGYFRLSSKHRMSTSHQTTTASEVGGGEGGDDEADQARAEGGAGGKHQQKACKLGRKPTATRISHSQKKRASETSALTTVSSIRSTTNGNTNEEGAQVQGKFSPRTPSKLSNGSPSYFCNAAAQGGGGGGSGGAAPPEERHFQFPPPSSCTASSSSVQFYPGNNDNKSVCVLRGGAGGGGGGQLKLQPGPGPGQGMDVLSVQSSNSNLAETSSNLERDLEIIDLLERERSMDFQQGLERERQEFGMRQACGGGGGRRQLPSLGRQGQSRRNLVTDSDQFERLLTSEMLFP